MLHTLCTLRDMSQHMLLLFVMPGNVEGSTRMPPPGLLYLQFASIEDLVNHGLIAHAMKRNAHCKCGSSSCARCSFTLYTCFMPQLVNVQAVSQTVF